MKKCIALLIICMMLICMSGCNTNKEESKSNDVVSVKTVSCGGMKMDYIKFGNGEKNFVILPGLSVHSVMGLSEMVKDAYKDFGKDYTVYLFDRSKNIKEGYTVRDMAEDTAKAMDKLNIKNADILGVSQGGMIALCLAIDYPRLVNKMVLGSTLAKGNDTFNRVVDEWIDLAEKKDEEALIESFVDKVYSENTLKEYRETLISSNLGITDDEYRRFLVQAKACKNFDCYDELSNIKCPVLVLGSNGDCVTTAKGSQEIADAIGCEIYLYDDSYGHGVYDEAMDYKERCMNFFMSDDK